MRPDLIRLLVDIRRKELVTEADPDGNIATYSTYDTLRLNLPLDPPNRKDAQAGLVGATRLRTAASRQSQNPANLIRARFHFSS